MDSSCAVEVCDRDGKGGRGYCYGHYKRLLEGRPLNTPLKRLVKGGVPCSVPSCDKRANSHGLCPTHTRRREAGTDLDAPVRPYIETDDLAERLRFYAPEGEPNECWEWTAARNKGYGVIAIEESKLRGAHIVAWEVASGRELPKGMIIRHTCDNPPCVNPAHLRLGTHGDNVDDKVGRERQSRGETHGMAKLNTAAVLEICARLSRGRSQQLIAQEFGVSQGTVSLIATGKGWAHVTGRGPA